jgi:CARDB
MSELDLIVSSVTANPSAKLNDSINISWTVSNQGDGFVSLNNWYDSIYISSDQILDKNDTFVSKFSADEKTPLTIEGSYTFSQNILLLNTEIGQRYLLFVTDVDNNQSETDENNNVYAHPIVITGNSDLVVSGITTPGSATLNEEISVSWTVENQGTEVTNANWRDAIFFSEDEFLDGNDIFITDVSAGDNTPLEAGGSYTLTQNLAVPSNFAIGSRYVLIVTDFYNNQSETEENNVFAQAITINAPDRDPDFSGYDFGLFSTLLGGDNDDFWGSYQLNHVYSVEVVGQGQPVDFYINDINYEDNQGGYTVKVYRQVNGEYESTPFETLTVDSRENVAPIGQPKVFSSPLEAGVNYRFEASGISTPDYRVSNWLIDAKYVLKTEPSNLVVSGISAPVSAALGESINLSWTVTNQGIVTAATDWYDAIYFSQDQFLDGNDIFITDVSTGDSTPLEAGGSYTITRNLTVPANLATLIFTITKAKQKRITYLLKLSLLMPPQI